MNEATCRAPVEHPGALGAHNKLVLDATAAAYRVALNLASERYTVLNLEIGERNPVIWLQYELRCLAFDPAVKVVRVRAGRREEVMVTSIDGCQVQWRLPGGIV